MATLAERFPDLPFAPLADEWLASIGEKTILDQLRERSISRVFLNKLKSRTRGLFSTIGTEILIQINEDDCVEEQIFTLGHELGHTFEGSPDVVKSTDSSTLTEAFCDVFAEQWIAINGKNNIEQFLAANPY